MEANKAPLALFIGLAFLAGAGVLAWFSSPATMTLTRADQGNVAVAFESRLFALFPIDAQRIDAARSAYMLDTRSPGSRSSTPARLTFETPSGPIDLGRVQQLFAPDFPDVRDFFQAKTTVPELPNEVAIEPPGSASISSIGRGRETIRFALAQLCVLFLAFVGGGVIWMAGAALFGRDKSIGPY